MGTKPSSVNRWHIGVLWVAALVGLPLLFALILANIGAKGIQFTAAIIIVCYWIIVAITAIIWQRKGITWQRVASIIKRWFINLCSRIGYWLAFSVAVALVPIVLDTIISPLVKEKFSLDKVLAHGELLAISLALMGEAIGYLLTNTKVRGWFKGLWGFSSLLVCLGSVCVLTAILVFDIKGIAFDLGSVTLYSEIAFGATLIVGSFCKWTER